MYRNIKICKEQQRPVLITISCIISLINEIVFKIKIYENELNYYHLVSILIVIIAIIGIWKMKVLAFFVFFSVFIFNQMILIIIDKFFIIHTFLSLIIIVILFEVSKKNGIVI